MTRRFTAYPGRPPEWAALAEGGPLFATERWLAAMRGRVPGAAYTFTLHDSGTPVLALYGTVPDAGGRREVFDLPYILTGDPVELPLSGATRALRPLAGAPPDDAWHPYLVVMLPGYECHPLGPLAGDPAALGELCDAIVAWAGERSLRAVAFLYTPPSAGALRDTLAARGFLRVPLAYTCELAPPGDRFDDYLASLPRRRRTEARRELRRLAEAGMTVRATEVAHPPPDVVELKRGHSAKYNGVPSRGIRARLEGLCAGGALLFRAEIAGTLVGYALFVTHDGVWYCVSTGMDYTRPDARHAYFATVFYEPVRLAYGAGVRRLHYGQGSTRAKTARGCAATELPGWILPLDGRIAPAVAESARTTRLA